MEMWVDDLAFEFRDGKWRAAAFCVISFEMEWRAGQFVRVRLIVVFIALLFFWLGRFGSSVSVLKLKPNRTGKIL
jgi:hypothetical protein